MAVAIFAAVMPAYAGQVRDLATETLSERPSHNAGHYRLSREYVDRTGEDLTGI